VKKLILKFKIKMKTKSILFVWALACVSIAFHSCKKDKEEEDPDAGTVSINAKWEISDAGSRYVSFEFNRDGNYIVVERSGAKSAAAGATDAGIHLVGEACPRFPAFPKEAAVRLPQAETSGTHFGNYTFQDKETLVLSGFGRIRIVNMTAESLSFTLTLDGQTQVMEFHAAKAKNSIATSDKTALLCRTWQLVSLLGLPVAGSDNEMTMLISRAGTYYYEYANGTAFLSQWKWYDQAGVEKESAISFSHDGWKTAGVAVINTLTEDTLILTDFAGIVYEFAIAAQK
jgi:hypothetical protein